MPVYLDCAATTPVDDRVREQVVHYLTDEFGNAGSRTHDFGMRAHRAVEHAREQLAAVVSANRGDVVFTSGGTESNNLALLGLAEYGRKTGRTHIISTQIEHHAILEPLRILGQDGFDVTFIPPDRDGSIASDAIEDALREDTLLVSVMQVNNETGVLQPITEICDVLGDHPVYFHVDAAQGYGKELESLRCPRVDIISVSGHKICAPKGIGALIARRRSNPENGNESARPPLSPLMYGGGQERGLRPGTLPVHLIVGLGKAAELAMMESKTRAQKGKEFRDQLLKGLAPLNPQLNGDLNRSLPYIINLSFPPYDSDSIMEAWKDLAAVSDGAACTSTSYTCSHVLSAMGLSDERMESAIRFSWCHLTDQPDWEDMVEAVRMSDVN